MFSFSMANNPNMKRPRCCWPSFIILIWWTFWVSLLLIQELVGHPFPPWHLIPVVLRQWRCHWQRVRAHCENLRFGRFSDYCESEISFLLRKSINQAGDDLVVSDTFVTRDHTNRRPELRSQVFRGTLRSRFRRLS